MGGGGGLSRLTDVSRKPLKNGLLLRFCSGETKHALIDGGIIIITRAICGDFTLKVAL